jgi:hypothetical protein
MMNCLVKNYSSFSILRLKDFFFFFNKMQIKYDINAPDFMIGEHVVCVFSNKNFGFKVVKT